jgi:hypothetical protein
MRAEKNKIPERVYYIKTISGSYIGPYSNKPSKSMCERTYGGVVVVFNLTIYE